MVIITCQFSYILCPIVIFKQSKVQTDPDWVNVLTWNSKRIEITVKEKQLQLSFEIGLIFKFQM